MAQQPASPPGRDRPGWAAPGSSAGSTGVDEPTTEQPPPFREAPTSELPPPATPPPFAPPYPSASRAVSAPTPTPPAPLPPPVDLSPTDREPVLPSSPPTYEPSGFGGGGGPLPPLPAYARPEPAPTPGRKLVILAALCGALVAAVVTGALFLAFDRDGTTTAAEPSSRLQGASGLDIQALLAKAQPSVVTVTDGSDDERTSAGTGVVVSADGDILTNAHVIARAQAVRVTLGDGTEYPAEVVGSFPDADVALLRVQGATDLVPAELGSSASALVGDQVVAIGNALNLGSSPSVTTGIISALDRTIVATPEVTLRGLIQTDAAINPGNSGGPLVNASGEVIGINTAIAADGQNIGFAIPIDAIKPLIEELRQGRGEVTPDTAFLGVSSQPVDALTVDERDQLGISASRGAVITEVQPDSPAAEAGLEAGDVVVRIDGTSISSADDLVAAIRDREPGDEVEIEYERNGRQREATTTLDRRGG